jgi:ArsR family transcriptional regulator, arsenate/arsenite/antimonite-responsive transcriptional repressor
VQLDLLLIENCRFTVCGVAVPADHQPDAECVTCTTAGAACCPPLTMPALSFGQASRTAEVFKALAHPHRVLLVNTLVGSGFPVCVCDLTAAIGLAQSTVSHHLKLLVQAGILNRQQRGIWAYYSVNHEVMRWLGSVVALDPAAGPAQSSSPSSRESVLT